MKDKLFVWDRPLRGTDLEFLGDGAPDGPILGARVEHLVAKEAMLQDPSGVFFTTPHFDGYPIVLAKLPELDAADARGGRHRGLAARAPSASPSSSWTRADVFRQLFGALQATAKSSST